MAALKVRGRAGGAVIAITALQGGAEDEQGPRPGGTGRGGRGSVLAGRKGGRRHWQPRQRGGPGSGRRRRLGTERPRSRCPPRRASKRGVHSRPPSPSTTMTTTQQSNSSREREGGGRWYGDGWRRRVTMVVVAMAPGLCWDNELGGRSLVSAIVSLAIEHDNNDLLNQQSTNNGGKRRRWWWRRGGGRCW